MTDSGWLNAILGPMGALVVCLLCGGWLVRVELPKRDATAKSAQDSLLATLRDVIDQQRKEREQVRADHLADLKEMRDSHEREIQMLKQSLDNLVMQLGGRMEKIELALKGAH